MVCGPTSSSSALNNSKPTFDATVKRSSLSDPTIYKIVYRAVDEELEITCKSFEKNGRAKGFEPSTSWSRINARKSRKSI
jgi:hypothetical protein